VPKVLLRERHLLACQPVTGPTGGINLKARICAPSSRDPDGAGGGAQRRDQS